MPDKEKAFKKARDKREKQKVKEYAGKKQIIGVKNIKPIAMKQQSAKKAITSKCR